MTHTTHPDTQLIQTVTAATFQTSVLDAPGPVAVEFMSYGCTHCREMEPVIQQAARDLAETEHVVRVNVAVDQGLASEYAIEGTPTFVMFRNGAEAGRAEGPHPILADVIDALTRPFAA